MKKTVSVLCILSLLISLVCMALPVEAESQDMRDMTTMELTKDMGLGINLGNTLESFGDWIDQWGDGTVKSYETAWGSPEITQEMIEGYAKEGFGTLRVPVAWSNMMGDNYTINQQYIDRVKQIVGWAMDSGLYVIMNIHHDGNWFAGFSTDKDTCMTKYTRVWEQLTEAFKDYDDHLIFESLNEEGNWDDIWNKYGGSSDADKKKAFDLLNEINQKFVDIVRASGGNNAKRHLLIAGYATDIALTCDDYFKMPNDPVNRCAVSVHYYTPSGFAILTEDADWGKARSTWGTEADLKELNDNMDLMKKTFIDNGIPVIIGEYGCPKENKEIDSVNLFLTSVCESAYERDMCPVLWDVTGLHYNRDTCKMYDEDLKAGFQNILKSDRTDGDINNDGKVNSEDIVMLKKHLMNISALDETQAEYADHNHDNVVNVFDLISFH